MNGIKLKIIFSLFIIGNLMMIAPLKSQTNSDIRLLILDPGHFHAALVQKTMYKGVDSTVFVYAPDGPDLKLHMNRVNSYNQRKEDPTGWKSVLYTGSDFFEKMISEKKGNVVVLAGNNRMKTEYILRLEKEGFNVLADKPMAINTEDYKLLLEAFQIAKDKNLLLYDIMTERYEITTVLQKELSQIPDIFGKLEAGTLDNPAVTKESVHHFYKFVSGSVLKRPAWFFDVEQEGEGIVDVTTHLVDLVQWECFPGKIIEPEKDIRIDKASRFPTAITKNQFCEVTGEKEFPTYLLKDVVEDTLLNVYSNGEINYQIKGVHARVSVKWVYKAPDGTGDTHYSVMRGTKAGLVIRQGKEQNYKPILYIVPVKNDKSFEIQLRKKFVQIISKYPGVDIKSEGKEWKVIIPEKYHEGHEAHFARVTEKFIEYYQNRNMPEWEVPNMLAKYYVTTMALEMAKETNIK